MKSIIEYRKQKLEDEQLILEKNKKLIDRFEKSTKIYINLPSEHAMEKIVDSLKKNNNIFDQLNTPQRLNEWIDYYEQVIDIYSKIEFFITPPDISPYPERIQDKVVSPDAVKKAEFIYNCLKNRLEELEKK